MAGGFAGPVGKTDRAGLLGISLVRETPSTYSYGIKPAFPSAEKAAIGFVVRAVRGLNLVCFDG